MILGSFLGWFLDQFILTRIKKIKLMLTVSICHFRVEFPFSVSNRKHLCFDWGLLLFPVHKEMDTDPPWPFSSPGRKKKVLKARILLEKYEKIWAQIFATEEQEENLHSPSPFFLGERVGGAGEDWGEMKRRLKRRREKSEGQERALRLSLFVFGSWVGRGEEQKGKKGKGGVVSLKRRRHYVYEGEREGKERERGMGGNGREGVGERLVRVLGLIGEIAERESWLLQDQRFVERVGKLGGERRQGRVRGTENNRDKWDNRGGGAWGGEDVVVGVEGLRLDEE